VPAAVPFRHHLVDQRRIFRSPLPLFSFYRTVSTRMSRFTQILELVVTALWLLSVQLRVVHRLYFPPPCAAPQDGRRFFVFSLVPPPRSPNNLNIRRPVPSLKAARLRALNSLLPLFAFPLRGNKLGPTRHDPSLLCCHQTVAPR